MKNAFGKLPVYLFIVLSLFSSIASKGQSKPPKFKVLAMAEPGGHHIEYSRAAEYGSIHWLVRRIFPLITLIKRTRSMRLIWLTIN
jgi:hypothetical protein